MKSLYELVAPYDSVSLIGMCKKCRKDNHVESADR